MATLFSPKGKIPMTKPQLRMPDFSSLPPPLSQTYSYKIHEKKLEDEIDVDELSNRFQKHFIQLNHDLIKSYGEYESTEKKTVLDVLIFLNEADTFRYLGEGTYGVAFVAEKGSVRRAFKMSTSNEESYWEAYLGSYFTPQMWKWGYEGAPLPLLTGRTGMAFDSKTSDPLLNMIDFVNFYVFPSSRQGFLQRSILGILTGNKKIMRDRLSIWNTVEWNITKRKVIYMAEMEMLDETFFDMFIDTSNDMAYNQITSMLIQIMSTLRHISRSNPSFIHGDLSLRNIMIKYLPSFDHSSLSYATSAPKVSLVDNTLFGSNKFLLYVMIDYGFSRSDEILKGLSKELGSKSRQIIEKIPSFVERPDEDDESKLIQISLLDLWLKNIIPYWDSDDYPVTTTKSMDLHTLGVDILFSMNLRWERMYKIGKKDNINQALDLADFVLNYMLQDDANVTNSMIKVVQRNYTINLRLVLWGYRLNLELAIKKSRLEKNTETKERLFMDAIYATYGEIRTTLGKNTLIHTLGEIATSPVRVSEAVINDIRYFPSAKISKTLVELKESTALNSNFWEHKIFENAIQVSAKRKAVRGEVMEMKLKPIRKFREIEIDPNVLRQRFIRKIPLATPMEEPPLMDTPTNMN